MDIQTLSQKLFRPVEKKFPVSSPFGNRLYGGKLVHHNGIDFATPVGTPIRASIDGVAHRAGWEDPHDPKKGYGLRIMQRFHLDGQEYFCWYGHCNELKIEEGDRIRKGEVIALSGNTGRSTGPHLHFGVRQSNTGQFFDVEFYTDEGPKDVI